MIEYIMKYNNVTSCSYICPIETCEKNKYRLYLFISATGEMYDYAKHSVDKDEVVELIEPNGTPNGKYVKTDGEKWYVSEDQQNWNILISIPNDNSCVPIPNDDLCGVTVMEC